MKKIALFLVYTTLFFSALLYFTPKVNLYFFIEEQIKPLDVMIANEEAVDQGFSLELLHAKLYIQKIKSADIGSAQLMLLGVYNTAAIDKVILDKTFEQFFPPIIEHIEVTQTLFAPLQLHGTAVGDFGEAIATVDLLERRVNVVLKPSKLMLSKYKSTLSQLKKSKEGDYRYDSKF